MKYNKSMRLLSMLTAVCLCLTFFTAGAGAAKTQVDGATAIVNMAVSQVGYYESSSGYSKYGDYFGSPYVPWCCAFVSWCARVSGIEKDVVPSELSCTSMRSFFINRGLYHKAPYYGGGYIPKPGDLVFFSWSSNPYSLSHIGIVKSANSQYAVVIEGNCPNRVRQLNRYYNSNIVGFATPAYNGVEVEAPKPMETGNYKLNGNMNFRSEPTTSASTIIDGLIPEGTIVNVTEVKVEGFRNWGKIEYQGKTGWVCLDYSSLTDEKDEPADKPSEVPNESAYTAGTYVADEATNLRTSASTSGGVILTVPKGGEFKVTEVDGEWGKATYKSYTGWMCLKWSTKTEDAATEPEMKPESKPEAKPGDVDNDGDVTSSDARMTLRASVGLEELSDAQKSAANISNEENITASSARTILRISVGLTD